MNNFVIFSYYVCMEFVVIVSWISYWIPYDSIPGRMSPIVTVLLAIINGLIGISGDFTPGQSCISMLEIYIIGALFQVYYLIDGIFYVIEGPSDMVIFHLNLGQKILGKKYDTYLKMSCQKISDMFF